MNRAIPFRSVFELTCHLWDTQSYRRNFDTGILDTLAPEYRKDRRLAKEMFRRFRQKLSIEKNSECMKHLFSCWNCEVQFSADDFARLGLEATQSAGNLRFKSLVMDGKVIGALRDIPVNTDGMQTLTGAKGLPLKVMNNRVTRIAMHDFVKSVMIHLVDNLLRCELYNGRTTGRSLSYQVSSSSYTLSLVAGPRISHS